MSNFRGTIAELVARNLTMNGVKLGAPELSVLTRLGRGSFANAVGTVAKPAGTRGKPATIWELNPNATLELSETVGAVTVDAAPRTGPSWVEIES